MKIDFHKYDGAGNDFVIVDNRGTFFPQSDKNLISHLCDRRRGIGADGLILLQNHSGYDFEMIYFNSDGNQSSMCGNGGRCMVAYANKLGLVEQTANFLAIDGPHQGILLDEKTVRLKMQDVENVQSENGHYVLDTGSPHFVQFTEDVGSSDIYEYGKKIRNSDPYKAKGINVNLVQVLKPGSIRIRTYERGVEAETLACGTGVTACAIASFLHMGMNSGKNSTKVITQGGDTLQVDFQKSSNGFSEIWLTGPAVEVFSGQIQI